MPAVISGIGQVPDARLAPGGQEGGNGGPEEAAVRTRTRQKAYYLELPVKFSGFFSISQNKINLMLIKAENPH